MRRLTTGLAAGIMVTGSLAVFGVTGAFAAGRTLAATPNVGLVNAQVVKVSGSGFLPNEQVYVIECISTATSAASCDINTATPATTDASGNLPSTNFSVVTGVISGTTTCGTSASDLNNCIISVGTSLGADTAATPITFAAPTTTTTTTTTTQPKTYHPKVTVSPSTRLKNGGHVKVTGRGFKPGDHVFIVECLTTVKGAAQCNLSTAKRETITRGGVLPTTTFKVVTGKVGTGTCGTKASNLRSCVISVGNAARADAALTHIAFAP